MYPYIQIWGITIPSYGFFIVVGTIVANLSAYRVIRKTDLDINDFWILEGYTFLGAIIGAKLLYLIVSFRLIDWSGWKNLSYLSSILSSGFVFYGGMIGGLLLCFAAAQLHHINAVPLVNKMIFGVPLLHGFGRIGCLFAGCCYGIPYQGIFAVNYPEQSYGPAGISCFPVQPLESIFLWILAWVVWKASMRENTVFPIAAYIIGYGLERFFLEFLRGDVERGGIGCLSTSQIISIWMVGIAMLLLICQRKRYKD